MGLDVFACGLPILGRASSLTSGKPGLQLLTKALLASMHSRLDGFRAATKNDGTLPVRELLKFAQQDGFTESGRKP